MTQIDLVFGGPGLKIPDLERLTTQLQRVFYVMKDGHWRTLAELANIVGGSEAGVSARLRDLRKERAGSHTVDKMRVADGSGLWIYRLTVNKMAQFNG